MSDYLNDSEALQRLADKLDKVQSGTVLIASIAEKLGIKWVDHTPKSVRGKLAKALAPTAVCHEELKTQKSRVLSHTNRAEAFMDKLDWENRRLNGVSAIADKAFTHSAKTETSAAPKERVGHPLSVQEAGRRAYQAQMDMTDAPPSYTCDYRF